MKQSTVSATNSGFAEVEPYQQSRIDSYSVEDEFGSCSPVDTEGDNIYEKLDAYDFRAITPVSNVAYNMIHHQEQMADSEEYETIQPHINPKRNIPESTGMTILDIQILETINKGK